jgi:hypothetical protein
VSPLGGVGFRPVKVANPKGDAEKNIKLRIDKYIQNTYANQRTTKKVE